jgi:serine/threonine protein kinase
MRVEDSGQGIQPHLRLADFSSAVDADSFARLYGQEGPTKDESTLDYAPPEVLFSSRPYEMSRPSSYDLWSVGVMILEMLFGTPEVFTVSQRSRAVLERELSRRSGASSWRSNSADADSDSFEDFEVQDKAEAFLLASFADLCIYMPGIHGPSSFSSPGESVLVSWSSVRDKGDEVGFRGF